MCRNISKNKIKNLRNKYSQELAHHAKQSAANGFKTASKRIIQKTAEATNDSIGNKIADKGARVSKTSPKNNSETNEEAILREIYIYIYIIYMYNLSRTKKENY